MVVRGTGETVLITRLTPLRLLSGPVLGDVPEGLAAHLERFGELPRAAAREAIPSLEASGLLGRGGAGFPVGSKWRALADRSAGSAVVLANGAEGEPASYKDRVLMEGRPHLVIDGAVLAADAVGADELIFYVGSEHDAAGAAMRRALGERRDQLDRPTRIVDAPVGYVAGEATAAVNFVNTGEALPTMTPPRVSERGVKGRPTLVQNVESLAYAALIARFGEHWYRSVGRASTRGTALITVSGAVGDEGVHEIELGTTVADVAIQAGGRRDGTRAILLGGYAGTWADAGEVWDLPLDPAAMRAAGLTFGCGIVGVLPTNACGVSATARIMRFMAREGAAQCGPCLHGLDALASATTRIASGHARADDLERIERLAAITAGRGACHHPDGAVQLVTSALRVFGEEFRRHARTGSCPVDSRAIDG